MKKQLTLFFSLLIVALMISGCSTATVDKKFTANEAPALLEEVKKDKDLSEADKFYFESAVENKNNYSSIEGKAVKEVIQYQKENGKVTLEKYTQIADGMTKDEVAILMKSTGKMLSENSIGGQTNSVYVWQNPGESASMTVQFLNGRVIGKTQVGL